MEDLQDKIIELMDLFDGEVTTADKIDRPQQALDREMFEGANERLNKAGGGMLVQPSADGSRPGYATDKTIKQALIDKRKVENITEETLNKFRKIIDDIEIKENKILGQNVKHLPQDVTVDKLSKLKNLPEGYKRPAITKAVFKMILNERGIKTYDNYRTEKIVKVLNNHLDKNKGDILSIKPSAASELLPEFKVKTGKTALGASQGGEGNSILKTYRNFISGGERIGQRSGISVPETIGGKPVSEIVTELDQNFLDIAGGRARGNFTVFEETKLLDEIANENPKVKALDLKRLYEEAGGTNFKQRLLGLIPAKTGSGYTKESVRKGGINILEKVQEGVISNSLPESLKSAFNTYASGFNQGRFLAEADKFRKSNPELAYRFVNAANIVAGKARRIGLTGAGEHALPISAIKTANAPVETLLQIDAYVDPEINNWKAKNFDEAIFSPNNGLAVRYKKAKGKEKIAIKNEIISRLNFMKSKAPELMKNVKFNFTNGIFTASSTTKAIDKLNETELKQLGTRGETIKNFFLKEMPDAITVNSETGRITSIKDSYIPKQDLNIRPTGTDGPRLGALDIPSMFKKLSPATRKLVGFGGGTVLPEVLFYQLDKANRMSKGVSEKEAAAGALESGTLGAYTDKAYMEELKKVAESMGIDSSAFDSAYNLNVLSKSFEQNSKNVDAQIATALENQDLKTAEDLRKNFNKYVARIKPEAERLRNDIEERVTGGSPLTMAMGRGNVTDKQYSKPFYDMQDVALEKLKKEKQKVFDTQKRQVDTAAGNIGEGFYQAFDSLTQGAKNLLQGRIIPFGPDRLRPLESDREREARYLKEMDPRELFLYNKARGYTYDNPITEGDLSNLQMEQPGLFFASGGRAGYKLGLLAKLRKSKVREEGKNIIDDSLKMFDNMKKTGEIDEISSDLDRLIKKTLDEDLFDKKDRIVDSINISEAKKRKNYPYNQQVFEEPKNLDFYRAIKESNFRTKTGPFFDRTKKAGGGLLKQAGDRSGPPPESGPNPQGLQGLLNRVKNT